MKLPNSNPTQPARAAAMLSQVAAATVLPRQNPSRESLSPEAPFALSTPAARPRSLTGEGVMLVPAPSILLLASEPFATGVAQRVEEMLPVRVAPACTIEDAEHAFRTGHFDLVVMEEAMAIADPGLTDRFSRLSGDAPLLEINFGISNVARIAFHIRRSLDRRRADVERARAAALHALRGELMESLTGLLLESELALRLAGPEIEPALQKLVALVDTMARQLRI